LSELVDDLDEKERLRLLLWLYHRFVQPDVYPAPFDIDNLPTVSVSLDDLDETPFA
jgi:hypothetical protein